MRWNPCQRLHLFSLTFSTHLTWPSDSHINYLLSIRVLIWLLLLYWCSHFLITLSRTHNHLRFIIVWLFMHAGWNSSNRASGWVLLWCKLAMRCNHLLIKSCSLAGVCLRTEPLRLQISVSSCFRCYLRNVCISRRCSIGTAFRWLEYFIAAISMVIHLGIKLFIWNNVKFTRWLNCILIVHRPRLLLTRYKCKLPSFAP